jgi:hypothetical protein
MRPVTSLRRTAVGIDGGQDLASRTAEAGELDMLDLIVIAVGVGAFALLAGYGALCDRL